MSFLSQEELNELKKIHKKEKNRKFADRIKAVIMLNNGYNYSQIAEILLLDDETIRRIEKRFIEKGVEALLCDFFSGKSSFLNDMQKAHIKQHVSENCYATAAEVRQYINSTFAKKYGVSGVKYILNQLGFVHKKPHLIPGKANKEEQLIFLDKILNLINTTTNPVYFSDGVHPTHNLIASKAWILKGEEKELRTNTGRQRINIYGAIEIRSKEFEYIDAVTVNSSTVLELFDTLECKHHAQEKIYLILDNARYHYSKEVQAYLKTSKIELIFLPAYSPNLNLIERLWKFYNKKVRNNIFYRTFTEFKNASLNFFDRISDFKENMDSLLSLNFKIIET